MTTIYGIKNCDTVKKSLKWLEQHQQSVDFHDFRKQGLDKEQVSLWLESVPAEILLNKRGTTWRKLDPAEQEKASTNELAQLLTDNPTLIKRPVLEHNGQVHVGFKPDQYAEIFSL